MEITGKNELYNYLDGKLKERNIEFTYTFINDGIRIKTIAKDRQTLTVEKELKFTTERENPFESKIDSDDIDEFVANLAQLLQ